MANKYFALDDFVQELVTCLNKQRKWDEKLNTICSGHELFYDSLYLALKDELSSFASLVLLEKVTIDGLLLSVKNFLEERDVYLKVENQNYCSCKTPDLTSIIIICVPSVEPTPNDTQLETSVQPEMEYPHFEDLSPLTEVGNSGWDEFDRLMSQTTPITDAEMLNELGELERALATEQNKSVHYNEDLVYVTSYPTPPDEITLVCITEEDKYLSNTLNEFKKAFSVKKLGGKKKKSILSKNQKEVLEQLINKNFTTDSKKQLHDLISLNLKTIECYRLVALRLQEILVKPIRFFEATLINPGEEDL